MRVNGFRDLLERKGLSRDNRRHAGFTLIEIMIVIAILAAVLAIGAPRLFDTKNQKRSAVRKLAVTTRDIRNVARLKNATVRLAINMDDEKGHSYWVESASGNVRLLTEEQEEELSRLTEMQRGESEEKGQFSPETSIVKKPVQLPRGLFFESVEYGTKKEAITGGTTYIHFFSQGLAEETAIHLTDKQSLNWTITIHPLTGRAQVFERKVALKELKSL